MRLRLACTAALAALALSAPPAGAATDPAVAMAPGGVAHLTWQQDDGRAEHVQERRWSPFTHTRAQYVSQSHADAIAPAIGIDSAQNAIVAWLELDTETSTWSLLSRRRGADGSLGAVQKVAGSLTARPQFELHVAAGGIATFAYTKQLSGSTTIVQMRRRTVAGALSAPQTVSPLNGRNVEPRLGVDSAGNALIAWERFVGDSRTGSLQARTRSAGGTLGATEVVALSGVVAPFAMEVGADGSAAFAWEREGSAESLILGRVRADDGRYGNVLTISPTGAPSARPRVALDGTGRVVFAWIRDVATGQAFEARIRSAGGTLGARFEVAAGDEVGGHDARVDPDGNVLFSSISGAGGSRWLRLRRRSKLGVMAAPQDVATATAGSLALAQQPPLEIDASGNALVAWTQWFDHGDDFGLYPEIIVRERFADGTMPQEQSVAR